MVRALLAGRKTQTRRIVKEPGCARPRTLHIFNGRPWVDDPYKGDVEVRCPFGQPGDRLWVREAWRVCGGREYEYQQDRGQVMYRATHEIDGFPLGWESYYKWRPSIHMPRWASRITLEIRDVRVERLQEISVADAIAEGVNVHPDFHGKPCDSIYSPVQAFRDLWESIHGLGAWEASPWVWAVAFQRVQADADQA